MLRGSLSLKILLFALLNVLLLAVFFLIFARLEFRFNLSSALLGPARDRIVSVSSLLALQLPDTDPASWGNLLAQYASKYPAKFYLFDQRGRELAGAPVQLPAAFLNELRHDPFTHPRTAPGGQPPLRRENQVVPPPGWRGEPPPGPPPGPSSPEDRPPRREERPDPFRGMSFPPRHGSMPDSPLALMRTTNPVSYWVGVRVPIWRESEDEPIHATLVWQIPSLWTEPFFVDYRPWLAVVLTVVLISVACWLPLVRGLTRAISRLTAATGQIADGHFEITLQIKRRDELGRLSESINRMAQRLSGLVDGQKRFLSDIAHELSSPLARMGLGLGILEQRASEDDLEYVSGVREEVEHMSGLVNELLTFSKSRAGRQRLQVTPVQLHELVERVLAREHKDGSVVIETEIDGSMMVLAEPEYLFRAIANVLRNAIRYAGIAGPIHLSAVRSDGEVCISVADQGPGLPESELENVFRPFYRPEFARQRETGGTGLGLAIVRDCVEACGGTVRCQNRIPNGLDVQICLPAAS